MSVGLLHVADGVAKGRTGFGRKNIKSSLLCPREPHAAAVTSGVG